MIDVDVARDRVLFLEDARATEASPLVRRRVRPALVFRRPPDRLRSRVRSETAGVVEGNARVVAERRLRREVPFVGVQSPLRRDVRRAGILGRHPRVAQQHRGQQRPGSQGSIVVSWLHDDPRGLNLEPSSEWQPRGSVLLFTVPSTASASTRCYWELEEVGRGQVMADEVLGILDLGRHRHPLIAARKRVDVVVSVTTARALCGAPFLRT